MIISRLLIKSLLLLLLLPTFSNGQTMLFSYGDNKVDLDEFKRVYEKSNKEGDFTEESIREYLDLYVKFKLKVKDAEDDGLDTLIQVRRELAKYQNQLMESYLDKAVTESMVKETYDKMKEVVKVRHMFFAQTFNNPLVDTVAQFNKALNAYQRVTTGKEAFARVAEEVSEDPSAKQNQGNYGWIAAGTIPIAEFENMAYATPLNTVSPIFRSNIGYHFLKVEGRKANPGIVQAAHILVKFEPNSTESDILNKKKVIDSIYDKLIAGADFCEMAELYSEDRTTHTNCGMLPKFTVGQMVPEFAEVAYALKDSGDIAKPIRTLYGWHIIMKISQEPIKSYEEMQAVLRAQIKQGNTYKTRKENHINEYAGKGKLKVFQDNLTNFTKEPDSTLLRTIWKAKFVRGNKSPLLRIGDYTYTVTDFADYLELNQRQFRAASIDEMVRKAFGAWKEQMILDYSFDEMDPAYRPLMKEYRDGILLFEQTEIKVWSKGLRDTMGLINFYNNNLAKYGGTDPITWEVNEEIIETGDEVVEVANGKLYICKDEFIAKKLRKEVKKGKSDQDIKNKYNIGGYNAVTIESGAFPKGRNTAIDSWWKTGVSKPIATDGRFVVVSITNFSEVNTKAQKVEKLIVNYPENFKEKKGFIIADYQKMLEEAWIRSLKAKYPIYVNEEALKSMVSN